MAQMTVNVTGYGLELWSPLKEMKYLFKFYFHPSTPVEAKRSVEFRHSTLNVSRIRRKVENRVSLHKVSYKKITKCYKKIGKKGGWQNNETYLIYFINPNQVNSVKLYNVKTLTLSVSTDIIQNTNTYLYKFK